MRFIKPNVRQIKVFRRPWKVQNEIKKKTILIEGWIDVNMMRNTL